MDRVYQRVVMLPQASNTIVASPEKHTVFALGWWITN